jgi:hypothetical protein
MRRTSLAGSPQGAESAIRNGRIGVVESGERNARVAEAVRVKRLREDAQRPLGVNLAEGIALSHKLIRFAGTARKA